MRLGKIATASIIAPKLKIYLNLLSKLLASFVFSEIHDQSLNRYSIVKIKTEKYSKYEKYIS
tara:strand:+ start:1313 stop:1498 length:186 start_codon:yes stop_codon:yes gene_type:complete